MPLVEPGFGACSPNFKLYLTAVNQLELELSCSLVTC